MHHLLRPRIATNSAAPPLITPSSGVHITLPAHFRHAHTHRAYDWCRCSRARARSPEKHGLIVPKTKDGRVVFLLPWLGSAIAGTTDSPTALTALPRPTAAEVDFILATLGEYLAVQPRRQDVLSAWSGIRPLAADPSKAGTTENLTRDHVLVADAGMLTITGGKWTTYRKVRGGRGQARAPPSVCVLSTTHRWRRMWWTWRCTRAGCRQGPAARAAWGWQVAPAGTRACPPTWRARRRACSCAPWTTRRRGTWRARMATGRPRCCSWRGVI